MVKITQDLITQYDQESPKERTLEQLRKNFNNQMKAALKECVMVKDVPRLAQAMVQRKHGELILHSPTVLTIPF